MCVCVRARLRVTEGLTAAFFMHYLFQRYSMEMLVYSCFFAILKRSNQWRVQQEWIFYALGVTSKTTRADSITMTAVAAAVAAAASRLYLSVTSFQSKCKIIQMQLWRWDTDGCMCSFHANK